MAQVAAKTLNWLYSVLTSEYQDVNRTFNDVAQGLSQYPSLSPRTDVYTFETGTSALLLHLSGTLPVSFRGTVYNFPITLWMPYTYPREAPFVYVTPTTGMMIRPGQHVAGEGRVYHPYLAGWGRHWDKSNLVDLLSVLQDVFAKEPPVVAQQQQQQQHRRSMTTATIPLTTNPTPPPIPPLPPEFDSYSTQRSQSVSGQPTPPPPPPKPSNTQLRGAVPLPLLPLPGRASMPHVFNEQRFSNGPASPATSALQHLPPRPFSLREGNDRPTRQSSLVLPPRPAPAPYSSISPTTSQPPIYQRTPPQQHQNQNFQPPPPDLTLQRIGATLYSHRQASLHQTHSLLASLQSQQRAMHESSSRLQSELDALRSLDATLTANERILADSMRRADDVMDQARSRATVLPKVEDLLVAPTVVGGQLYRVVAEERALADAMFVLARGLDRGRVGVEAFLKQTRSLARERFLKMALQRKIARGMGLIMETGDDDDDGEEGRG
ncbi:MAG: hypothetical protein M1816_001796 [Peltula sp. TS41687]|nr:MAG: hypothetical protein M1816_001796 [Peltula sp. TS41687]